jgi:hypothetical protein
MTLLRWNWSASIRGSLKTGSRQRPRQPLSAAHTYDVALGAPMAASERAPARLCRELWRGVPSTRGASRAPTGPLGRQLTDTMLEHRSLPPSPPWAGRRGEGRSGSKGGEGCDRGGNRCSPRKGVSFSPDPPWPCPLHDFKDASKAVPLLGPVDIHRSALSARLGLPAVGYRPLIRPASISKRLKRRASDPSAHR